ncbi:MAG TPA: helix-turn-helix domain-containing protein [Chloroflexota bacterium]
MRATRPATVAPTPTRPQASLADKLLLSDVECAALLGCSRSQVRVYMQRGALHSIKLGGLRRVLRRDLDAFIDGLCGAAEPADAPTEPVQ